MKKVLSLIFVLALILVMVSCATSDDSEKEVATIETNEFSESYTDVSEEAFSSSPNTAMDLFDGGRRVWYCTGPRYDAAVTAIVVTKDKQVVEMYYTLVGKSLTPHGEKYEIFDCNVEPNPYSCEPYLLSDFDSMNDDEVLDLVRKNYADASKSYKFSKNEYLNYQNQMFDYEITASNMPYDIEYSGELDDSGNAFEWEIIKIFQKENFGNLGTFFNGIRFDKYTTGHPLIAPTIVKNEEYVGFQGFITRNTFKSLGNVTFDDVDGMADWDYNFYRY